MINSCSLCCRSQTVKNLAAISDDRASGELCPCCDTLQVADYGRYRMAGFSEAHKKQMREKQFPRDLEQAFRLGARLSFGSAPARKTEGRPLFPVSFS